MSSSISAGTTAGTALAMAGDTSGALVLQTNGTTTAVTLDTSQNATFAGKVTSAGALTLASNGTTTAVTIDTSQNVGIGTATPAYKLDVSGTLGVTGAATLTTLRATTGGSVHPIQYDGSATNRAIIQSDNGTIILFDIGGLITPTLPLISGLTLPFQITVALASGAGGTIVLTRSGTNDISFNAVTKSTATTIVHGSTLTLAANSNTGRWITLGINGTWT